MVVVDVVVIVDVFASVIGIGIVGMSRLRGCHHSRLLKSPMPSEDWNYLVLISFSMIWEDLLVVVDLLVG